ncbi:MAG TPA: Maf family nucleotide pyrophosphatase [Arenibacter sp.]|nr:Maf family nucleotide pyrophosphatase [Arenibacter sp.]
MLREKLKDYRVILASASPRRQQFFTEMEIPFEVHKMPVDEIYPGHLQGKQISDYLARLKAGPFMDKLREKDILVTSDTVVWHKDTSLAKPRDEAEAVAMLRTLSGDRHQVITSVCLTTSRSQKIVSQTTQVKFRNLEETEIHYYVHHYRPFDKAGGYGIQEWIGLVGIEEIQGSYPNVVGLPTHLVYSALLEIMG